MTIKTQQKKTAKAVSGRTARACESCVKKRARWYCLADDAFLCQSCDSSVHSANELASRHKRVRLETASSFKKADLSTHRHHRDHHAAHDRSPCNSSSVVHAAPASSWQRRKPRTPRPPPTKQSKFLGGAVVQEKTSASISACLPLVPEIERDKAGGNSPTFYYDDEEEINEEAQMLFSVPVLDPFFTHDDELSFYKSSSSSSKGHGEGMGTISSSEHDHDGFDFSLIGFDDHGYQEDWDNYFPSDAVLAEFAAAAESCLLAGGSGGGEIMKEKLGTLAEGYYENKYKSAGGVGNSNGINLGVCSKQVKRQVKVENRDHRGDGCMPVETSCTNLLVEEMTSADGAKDASNINVRNYDHRSSSSSQNLVLSINEEQQQVVLAEKTVDGKTVAAASTFVGDDDMGRSEIKKKRKIFLRLNYEDVITSWADQGSPWTTGSRPEHIDPDHDGWPTNSCSMAGTTELHHHIIIGGEGDGEGREARVLRYREKRKNRLFSKKIRYQVRKINAEKRPRLKGRFVKRAAYTTTTFAPAAAAAATSSFYKQG